MKEKCAMKKLQLNYNFKKKKIKENSNNFLLIFSFQWKIRWGVVTKLSPAAGESFFIYFYIFSDKVF